MKQIILFFLFLFLIIPVNAVSVSGGVEYNYESSTSCLENNFECIQSHLIDSNNIENLNYLYSGEIDLKDRILADFSDGTYGIVYKDNPLYAWYYANNGHLINYTKKSSYVYPCKITKYKPDGTVINIGRKLSDNESYIYSSKGRLIAHWIGNNCYDRDNNLIMTRKYKK